MLPALATGLLLLVAAAGPLAHAAGGDAYVQEAALLASDGQGQSLLNARDEGDQFGRALALQGDRAFVGAPYANNSHDDDGGSVYLFAREHTGNWAEVAKIEPDWGHSGATFGWALAVDGDRLVVGAPEQFDDGAFRGVVFVFDRQEPGVWEQTARLSVDAGRDAGVGWSVDVDGNTILVGTHSSRSSSSAHVFERGAHGIWLETATLTAPDASGHDDFGFSVALDGDRALVGARRIAVDGHGNAGAAFVYERVDDAWLLQDELTAKEPSAWDLFGQAVALDGAMALVGEPWDRANGDQAGAGHVFARDAEGFSRQAKLLADDGTRDDELGSSVALDGDRAVLGAGDADTRVAGERINTGDGAAYVFTQEDGWGQASKLRAADGASDAWHVAIDGERVLAGEPLKNNANGFEAGSAYVFAPVDDLAPDAPGGGSP